MAALLLPCQLTSILLLTHTFLCSSRHVSGVFVLAPGKDIDPVKGNLKELDLTESDLSYQALSYTWIRPENSSASGNFHQNPPSRTIPITQASDQAPYAWEDQPKPHHVIIENHSILPITCNLLSALTRIRSPYADVVLFVDALSIDQGTSDASLKDRSQQIKLMRNIFRGAERVLADLGDYEDGAVDCLDTIQCVAGVDSEVWNAYEANPQGMMPGMPPRRRINSNVLAVVHRTVQASMVATPLDPSGDTSCSSRRLLHQRANAQSVDYAGRSVAVLGLRHLQ